MKLKLSKYSLLYYHQVYNVDPKKKHPDHAFMIRVLNGRLLVSPLACLDRFLAP